MKIIKYPSKEQIQELLKRPIIDSDYIRGKVNSIIESVKLSGDRAIYEFTRRFDGIDLKQLSVSENEFSGIENKIDEKLKKAINIAWKNIFKFHKMQKTDVLKMDISDGITCWQKSVPIEKVGLYIPGGSSPLFSTLLMLGIPAKIAECREIIICTPPQKNDKISESILYVAELLGNKQIFKIGGVQAIAAMAFGTETIPKVDKIFGPGNQWVNTAKQIVNSFGVAIDLPAGPSEVLIIADDSAKPEFIAADLLSQAEHGPDSQVVLISTNEHLIDFVYKDIEKFKYKLTRRAIIDKALQNSVIMLVNDLDAAIKIANKYAPEHLILSVDNAESESEKIINAGSVFIGNYSPEAAGDYASGTNHTLPTNGFASAYSGVSLDSFMKKITFQKLTKPGLNKLSETIETMAEAESLCAHKLAVTVRHEGIND